MEKKVLNKVVLSLGTAVILGLTGCSSSSDGGNSNNGGNAGSAVTSTTTSGTASDGYIKEAVVCLDMNLNNKCDNNVTYKEPFTVTDVNGSYSLEVSAADKAKAATNAPLLLVGGTDIDTNSKLTGTFKAPFDPTAVTTTVQITPLSTLVSAMIDKNVSVATAYKQVAKALGLSETQVKSDPVQLAKDGDKKVIQAAMTIHRVITTMAKSASVDNSEIYTNLVTAINTVADDNTSTNKSIATIVTTAANETNSALPPKARDTAKVAITIETTISNAIDNNGSIEDAALASDEVVDAIQTTVQTALDNNKTIDDNFVTSVEDNASATLSSANPVKIAVKNLLSSYLSYGATLPDSDINSIASHFTTSSDVSAEAIIALDTDTSIDPVIISDLKKAYKAQGIKSYVLNLGYTISDDAIKLINLDNFSSTMTKKAFADMAYATQNPELMTLALQINPPADIASMSDIQKAKNLFTSVRTQVNQADTFTKNESTKIDTALNSVSNSVTFTTTLFGTLNDMVGQAIDTNQTTASRLVGGGDRNITISKTTASNNVSWAYTIKDTNVTTSWDGTLTYTDVNPDNFNPADFTTLSAKLTGTTPIDTYGATIADGKTNSQDLDANVNINKIANGATLKLNATITNNGDSVSVTDANIKSIYDVNSTNNEPLVKYVELQNLYIKGTVGDYTLDGKLDVPSYAINKIGEANGFDPKTTYYSFGIGADCTNTQGTGGNGYNHGGIANPSSVRYNGVPASQYNPINSFLWFDKTTEPVDTNISSSYSNLICSNPDETLVITQFYYDSWTDDDLQNSGHLPSQLTFDGTLTNNVTSEYLNANIDAKWTNIVDANLSDEMYKPDLDITVKGTLTMPESALMNVALTYKNVGISKTAKVTYVNGDISITADTAYSDDNGTKIINLSSTAGIKSTITLNGDNTVDYTKSTVTDTSGKTVGAFEDRAGAAVVKYSDGTFDSLF